jgi:hypothetical protein
LSKIRSCTLPEHALLQRYRLSRAYTDCYSSEIEGAVTQATFVEAFYTTGVFKVERLILQWAVSKSSTDTQAALLAQGKVDGFSAWIVEERTADQLLLCDMHGRTRSWLMTMPIGGESGTRTRLYFGSAVVPAKGKPDAGIGTAYRLLLGFHKLYSRVLLHAAKKRLQRRFL